MATIRELRKTASKLGIKRYSRYTKAQLEEVHFYLMMVRSHKITLLSFLTLTLSACVACFGSSRCTSDCG